MNIKIAGGRVIDPASGLDQITDLYIGDGEILAIGDAPEDFHCDELIQADGQIVCPGLIDLCAHLREPGKHTRVPLPAKPLPLRLAALPH